MAVILELREGLLSLTGRRSSSEEYVLSSESDGRAQKEARCPEGDVSYISLTTSPVTQRVTMSVAQRTMPIAMTGRRRSEDVAQEDQTLTT